VCAPSPQEPIPASLKADAENILQHGHRLLNGLLNICMEQRFVTATINCIEFSQHLTQGLWFHSNPLLQLPHFDQREVKLISHKLSKTPGSLVEKAKELGPEKRREALHGLSEEQHVDIDLFLDHFPDIDLSYDARVEDEEDVREGDVLNLTVTVVRKHLPDDGLPDEDDEDDDDDPDEAIFDKELEAYDEVSTAETGTATPAPSPNPNS
jgi:preprotein translocase subunit Sec63